MHSSCLGLKVFSQLFVTKRGGASEPEAEEIRVVQNHYRTVPADRVVIAEHEDSSEQKHRTFRDT